MDASAIERLRGSVTGRVILPGDDDFDDARATFNATTDRRPTVIVRPVSTADVVAAARWAAALDLPISVRGGGHSVAGHAIGDDALCVDLREMRQVRVDPAARRAVVQGGALWEDVDRATMPHDLATTGGTFWDTGVGGLTLSGGLGYLMGTAGLTCDNLMRATVVTATGDIVEAGPSGDRELLWALRGGGGNFGVVTEFEFQLHPIGPWQAGRFVVHLDQGVDALEALGRFARDAPDEVVIFVLGPSVETAPLIGAPSEGPADFIAFQLIFQGTHEAAEAALAAVAAIPGVHGGFEAQTYEQIQVGGGTLPFGLRHYWKGHFVRDLDRAAAEAIVTGIRSRPGDPSFVLLEAITGRSRHEPEGGAAFGQRAARWNVSALAIWEDIAKDDEHIAWARGTAEAIAPSSYSGAGYGNYASADETAERVRAGFGPERFARLQAVKRRYDPTNRFRFNLNVPPGPPAL
jgi:FAD/FMN-containing dehydrogenase